jgi:hypothetical protein
MKPWHRGNLANNIGCGGRGKIDLGKLKRSRYLEREDWYGAVLYTHTPLSPHSQPYFCISLFNSLAKSTLGKKNIYILEGDIPPLDPPSSYVYVSRNKISGKHPMALVGLLLGA